MGLFDRFKGKKTVDWSAAYTAEPKFYGRPDGTPFGAIALTEGTETILLFVLSCLFPAHFAWLAWLFGALCWLTTATRIASGYQTLKRVA